MLKDGKSLCVTMKLLPLVLAARLAKKVVDDVNEEPDVTPNLLDVTPLSLGIRTQDAYYRDIMSVVIPKNTPLPTTKMVAPLFCYNLHIGVFQGESGNTTENIFLGGINIDGLAPHPGGKSPVEVLMSLFKIQQRAKEKPLLLLYNCSKKISKRAV